MEHPPWKRARSRAAPTTVTGACPHAMEESCPAAEPTERTKTKVNTVGSRSRLMSWER